jgi:urease accessory protein
MLAMTAVGLWAAQRGGTAMLAWPCAFVTAMLAGYELGLALPGLFIEPMILASVIALGSLAAAGARPPMAAGLALVAAFGLCHGFAHGSEAPAAAGSGFALGMAIATAGLHLAGLGMGRLLLRLNRPGLLHSMGGGVALGGLILAVAG